MYSCAKRLSDAKWFFYSHFSFHAAQAQLTPRDGRKQAALPIVSDPTFSFLLLGYWGLLPYLQPFCARRDVAPGRGSAMTSLHCILGLRVTASEVNKLPCSALV